MAQTYTLEEAAQRLGIAPEAMKRRLREDWKTVRSFRDGPTLRFRGADIDELARSLGERSDPSLQLAPLEIPDPPTSSQFELPEIPPPPPRPAEEPLLFGGDDDLFTLPVEEPAPKAKAGDSDSDVRLDTKMRAAPPKTGRGKKPFEPPTESEEVPLDLAGPGSAVIRGGSAAKLSGSKSSPKLSAADSNKHLDAKSLGDGSEFELSLDADSDDFEIQMNPDAADDEVSLGSLPKRKGQKGGESGINLQNPADSGINLERKAGPPSGIRPGSSGKLGGSSGKLGGPGGKLGASSGRLGKSAQPDSDLDFELSLDPPRSGPNLGGPRSGKLPPISHSDSEFELSLDDPSSSGDDSLMSAALPDGDGQKDIFETDFEIPPLEDAEDSGSEAVAVEGSDTDLETSDFDLALDSDDVVAEDESGSQVVLLEDGSDEAPPARSAAVKRGARGRRRGRRGRRGPGRRGRRRGGRGAQGREGPAAFRRGRGGGRRGGGGDALVRGRPRTLGRRAGPVPLPRLRHHAARRPDGVRAGAVDVGLPPDPQARHAHRPRGGEHVRDGREGPVRRAPAPPDPSRRKRAWRWARPTTLTT